MKSLLSLVLVAAMIIALLPVVSAGEAKDTMSGITVKYDFSENIRWLEVQSKK